MSGRASTSSRRSWPTRTSRPSSARWAAPRYRPRSSWPRRSPRRTSSSAVLRTSSGASQSDVVAAGQDAADLSGLVVAVPVQDRVQVVQVRRAAVTGQLALQRRPSGTGLAVLANVLANRAQQGSNHLFYLRSNYSLLVSATRNYASNDLLATNS